MLSRRSVRVKVMQLLYSMDRDETLVPKDVYKSYDQNINKSYELFLYTIYIMELITFESVNDHKKRSSKHLPTDLDKIFSAKLYNNDLIQNIVGNKKLAEHFKKMDFAAKLNEEYVKKVYLSFAKTDEYTAYLEKDTEHADHLEILLELYRHCRQDEYFNEMLEDTFFNWVDDKSLVVGAFKKYLKILPVDSDTAYMEFLPQDDTVKDFGQNLLKSTIDNSEKSMSHIIPVLENWDHERLAVIDTILIKMALTELINFNSIPSKVTLNEYVELAKNYSTIKSKEFVNGVLDKLMKQLMETGEIKKEGRGLIDQ